VYCKRKKSAVNIKLKAKLSLFSIEHHTLKTYMGSSYMPEGKRALGRPRHRWENNIKMDLNETGWEGADWIHPAQYRDR
jgi:hypothetical protein